MLCIAHKSQSSPLSPRPAHLSLNWLIESNFVRLFSLYLVFAYISYFLQMPVDRGHRYVHLMRTIYHLANVSTTLPILSSRLLQALFIYFKEDALIFLVGVWSTSDAEVLKELRSVALLHAAAFLEAHILEDDGIDFQTILPSLLVALQDSDARICQGA
jgi:U3 small nucleolar RNA-associated protein 10